MPVRIPHRLASFASLTAAAVAAAFAPIVAALNGGLSAANYAPRVRLPGAMKAAGRAIFAAQAYVFQTMVQTTSFYVPWPTALALGGAAPADLIRWTVKARAGAVTGTIKLFKLTRSGAGYTSTQIGTTLNLANAVPAKDEALAVAVGAEGDLLQVELALSAGATNDLIVTVWGKVRHVR